MVTFHRSMPILEVSDVVASGTFYREKLGFQTAFFGDPPAFCIVGRDAVTIGLDQARSPNRAPQNAGWAAYLYVDDAEALCGEFRAAGVDITREPEDTFYGCRDFDIRDPDGHLIAFGQDLHPGPDGPGL